MNITPDWNNHLDEIAKHVLAMQRLALTCGDIMQSAALLKTIERLHKRVEDSRLAPEQCPLCKGMFSEFCSHGFHAP